ncbi:hypothetical protein EDEG_01562 [Edhazardia aedis USNM 41457]|uniref:GID complex catalytic subunit 2 n=1 Tax=Edhazardia aedis (strain USNM 41457) TaxID=1003232 RepID=J9D8Q1_EDHAE|nr:hypothetical protein EDEG_01562 [Edhazardia aedis USNM 41457]|eukprot:EJW04126.1 hypothetical protein EDEG_01562 [Edhazardia aedis USNM 41457]
MDSDPKNLEEFSETFYTRIMHTDNEFEIDKLKVEYINTLKSYFGDFTPKNDIKDLHINILNEKNDECYNLTEKILALDLLRTKQLDVFDSFVCESQSDLQKIKEKHEYLMEIQNLMKNDDFRLLELFIEKENLYFKRNMKLCFILFAIEFLQMILHNNRTNAIIFMYHNFRQKFSESPEFIKDSYELIQSLVDSDIKFIQKIIKSYKDKAFDQFKIDYCLINEMPQKSPFDQLLEAGQNASSILRKFSDNIDIKTFDDIDLNKKIPIDLPVKPTYHSIFVCPVLKQFCDNDNPPVLLPCGHVISALAVKKLSKKVISTSFKCPYCPYNCNVNQLRELKL